MKKLDKVALLEGIKELIRTSLIAVVPIVIAQLQKGDGIQWQVIGVAALIAILSGIDKWLHTKDIQTPLDLKPMDKLIQ